MAANVCSQLRLVRSEIRGLGGNFEFIHAMRVIPFNQRVALQLAVITAAPGLSLLLLVVPIEKVLDTLGGELL